MKAWIGMTLAACLCAAWPSGAWAQGKAVAPSWPALTPNTVYTRETPPPTPKVEDLPLKESVTQYGITWAFEKPARVGQFANTDFYVVGPVTITAIDPKPLHGKDIPEDQLNVREKRLKEDQRVRNGFMLNPPVAMKVAYDSAVKNWFAPSLVQRLPVAMKAGDSLVSTISMPPGLKIKCQLKNVYRRSGAPTRRAAVLTCVGEPQPADAFRPAFCDRQARIYLARNLKRELLPTLATGKSIPKIAQYVGFTQKPWVATCFFAFEQPMENMPMYGREYGRVVGIAALMLCTDLTPEQKEPLLVNFVQVGIDLGAIIRAGHPGWEAFGGHGNGRKLPIVFAGLLLGDEQLAHINKNFPKAHFGEDEQTAYGDCWTGAKVVFTGHRAIDAATGIARLGMGTGPYEHMQPATWKKRNHTSESYRRCCTSATWIAQALVMHLMKAQKVWAHDAFFDYCDRWMFEDETEALKAAGLTHPAWARQGKTWEPFVNEMWTKYRTAPGMPPTDGWKKPHDDSYLRNALEQAKKRAKEQAKKQGETKPKQ
jgi:hypothetical protein